MKNFIFGFIGALCLIGLCSFQYYETKNNKCISEHLSEYKLNGHYYVVACTGYKGGVSVIHSPNCKCGRK